MVVHLEKMDKCPFADSTKANLFPNLNVRLVAEKVTVQNGFESHFGGIAKI